MKQIWLRYAAQFDARSMRERVFIAATVVIAVIAVGYVTVIESRMNRKVIAQRQLDQQQTELRSLEQQTSALRTSAADPDAASRHRLERLQREITQAGSRLKTIERTLVAPEKIASLLEEILKRNRRLQLVSLRNLPAADVISQKEAKSTTPKEDVPLVAVADQMLRAPTAKERAGYDLASLTGTLYKHGVEITVTGNYAELMAYLAELERMPQQLLWNSVKLSVEEYPRSRMTLTVYTLSLDKAWLIV